MTLQTNFFTLAAPLVGNRVYPQGTAPAYGGEYMTYSRVSADEQITLDPNGGTGNLVNTRFQVDVYGLGFDDVQALAASLKVGLKAWALVNVLLGEQDMYEPDTKLHRVMLDLSIWHY